MAAVCGDTLIVTLETVSVAVAVLLAPPGPLQTSEYDVVAATAPVDWVPPAANVPLHPLDAVQDVALSDVHVSVDASPGAMTEGLTANVAVGIRLTAALALAVPPGPVQDKEYEVGPTIGPLLWLPLAASAPLHPPDAVQDVALLEVQVSVDDAPAATADGDAVRVTLGAARMLTVTATGALTPLGPAHVRENTLVAANGPVSWLPLAESMPLQLPDAVQAVAPTELQVSVEPLPMATFSGDAASCAVGGAFTAMVTLAVWLVPPGPEQLRE
jgi:hypothetical protein